MTLKEDRFAGKGIQINLSAQSAEKGQSLFNDVYGCFGCHKTAPNGEGGIVGPNLSNAAKRLKPQWIAAWLKDPESIRPDSPMPNFNLSGEEIQQLVAYILSLGPRGDAPSDAAIPAQMEVAKKGEELVLKKNCVFCHLLDTKKGQKDQNGSEGEAALTEAKLK
jgi:mono/diheme cytochrome c family protein